MRGFFRLALFLAVLVLPSCSPFRTPPPSTFHRVEGVPFRAQQQSDDCGPAALASVLAHAGMRVSQQEIRAAVYHPKLGGSLLPDMENFARGHGLTTRSGRGSLSLLRSMVDDGRPVVVLVEAGFGPAARPHYLVVFGYDQSGFLVHTGVARGRYIPAAELDSRWAARNRLYLILE